MSDVGTLERIRPEAQTLFDGRAALTVAVPGMLESIPVCHSYNMSYRGYKVDCTNLGVRGLNTVTVTDVCLCQCHWTFLLWDSAGASKRRIEGAGCGMASEPYEANHVCGTPHHIYYKLRQPHARFVFDVARIKTFRFFTNPLTGRRGLLQVGVSVGNAGSHARNASCTVTASNNEDGVAQAIEKFVLAPRNILA
eukprot:1190320-Prorocentrum_minimum.AAC.6